MKQLNKIRSFTQARDERSTALSIVEQPTANKQTPTLAEIIDLEDGKRGINEIINSHFLRLHGYSNINILWNAVQNSLPMFLNDNAINTVDDLWHLIQCLFYNDYVFNSPHIWQNEPNYPKNNCGLCINIARQHGGLITREQVENYFTQIKMSYNSVPKLLGIKKQDLFLQYDIGKYLLTESTNIIETSIENTLHTLFARESVSYVIPRDISNEWFCILPELPLGLPWTPLLLQEILRIRPQIGYRVIFAPLKGQTLDTVGAAIVPDKSMIMTFADVVYIFCDEKFKRMDRMPAEDLRLALREARMIDGNELIYNLHKALNDYRFAFSDENRTVKILER